MTYLDLGNAEKSVEKALKMQREREHAEHMRVLKEEFGLLPEFLERHEVCEEASHGCRLARNTRHFFTHCVDDYKNCSWRGVSQISITGMEEVDEYIRGVT